MNKNVICWFEIYVKDLERAKKFYKAVLGTDFLDAPAPPSGNYESFKMSMFTPPIKKIRL
jgi:predicted enzyme related to lactoylglutathione lyase